MTTYRIPITVSPEARSSLMDLILAFDQACDHLRCVAAKNHTRHQAALHALAYRDLCRPGLQGLPAQYAVRAISRVSHQLRATAQGLPDPYPTRSVDLDANCATILIPERRLALSTLDCRGLRGRTAQDARLRIPLSLPHELLHLDPQLQLHLAGATLVLPAKAKPYLTASLDLQEITTTQNSRA